jgi:hypothetical protein
MSPIGVQVAGNPWPVENAKPFSSRKQEIHKKTKWNADSSNEAYLLLIGLCAPPFF